MRENGTDRDVALLIASAISDIKDLVSQIETNMYGPVILTQPVNVEDAVVDESYTFTVGAANVASYQWQNRAIAGGQWSNSGLTGNKTDTLTVTATEVRYGYYFRCEVTGKDGTVAYTNNVRLIAPAS